MKVTFRLLLLEIRTQVFKDELVQCEYLFIVLRMYVNTFTFLWWIGCVLLYIIGIYVKWIILQRGGVPWLAEDISTDYKLQNEVMQEFILLVRNVVRSSVGWKQNFKTGFTASHLNTYHKRIRSKLWSFVYVCSF